MKLSKSERHKIYSMTYRLYEKGEAQLHVSRAIYEEKYGYGLCYAILDANPTLRYHHIKTNPYMPTTTFLLEHLPEFAIFHPEHQHVHGYWFRGPRAEIRDERLTALALMMAMTS